VFPNPKHLFPDDHEYSDLHNPFPTSSDAQAEDQMKRNAKMQQQNLQECPLIAEV